MVKRGLGRGLSALIPTAPITLNVPDDERVAGRSVGLLSEPMGMLIDSIQPNPYQPRTNLKDSELGELAQSIRTQGVLQPIVVRRLGDHYQIVAGERRWRAARMAGLERIPVVIRECSDREMLELAIVENLQRASINVVDSARAYRRLHDEFAMTQSEVAERVGKSRSAISNTLRLLELPADIQQLVSDGKLSEGHARALLMCDGAAAMRALAQRIVAKALSVRQAEKRAQATRPRTRQPLARDEEAILAEVIDRLRLRFATAVRVQRRVRGGTIELDFHDQEQLVRIVDLLLESPEGGGREKSAAPAPRAS